MAVKTAAIISRLIYKKTLRTMRVSMSGVIKNNSSSNWWRKNWHGNVWSKKNNHWSHNLEPRKLYTPYINTLRLKQNGRHFADDTFNRIFVNENVRISIKFSLKFVPKGHINNTPSLVQIMAWRWPGDKPLFEPMMVTLMTHICVTRLQWVKKTPHELYGILYHWHIDSLFNSMFRLTTMETSKLPVHYWPFVRGIHPVNSPHKGPVICSFSVSW